MNISPQKRATGENTEREREKNNSRQLTSLIKRQLRHRSTVIGEWVVVLVVTVVSEAWKSLQTAVS